MKTLLLLLAAMAALVGAEPKEGYERGIARYQNDACDKARTLAKQHYDIIEMDAGCRCVTTDSHEWQCDIGFTYTDKKH